MTIEWEGVYPAITTKFTAAYELDASSNQNHIQAQIDAGADGIIVGGSLGENSALSFDEKLLLTRLALETVNGRVPVVLTIAENTTADACRLAEQGARMGVDGFMVLPGMRYVSDARETLQHFRTVAQASNKPIMVYNNPVAYGVDVTPEMFVELADETKLVAIKESSDDIRRITDIINLTGDRYKIFCGVDNLALEALMMGAVGWVAGLVCAFPKETVAIYRLAKAGRFEEAREIYRWFAPLLKLDVATKLVQNIKLAESMTDLGTEYVRPPRLPLVDEERARVMAIIKHGIDTRPELPKLNGSH